MKASQATTLFNRLRCQLYSEGNCLPNSWGKAALSIGLATIVGLTGVTYGCALVGKNPPVIQNYKIPEWAVEGEKTDIEVSTFDDNGVRETYVQLNNGVKIPLSKVSSIKKGGERAEWKGSYEIPVGEHDYIIVAEDKAGNKSDPTKNEGKIIIHPPDADNDRISYRDEIKYGLDPYKPNPSARYMLDKNSGFLMPALKFLDEGTVMDENTKELIDLVILYYPKIERNVPGSVDKFIKFIDVLPADERFIVDSEYIDAARDLLDFASDPGNKRQVEMFLDIIKDLNKEDICLAAPYIELAKNPTMLRLVKSLATPDMVPPKLRGFLEFLESGKDLSKPINALSIILPLYCSN
ncbi:MAG: hypothetical protein FJ008_07675 [Chloroflexi bacterium]|nr:hypothetical protein [Chloroflexota bacterium]